MPTRTRSCSSEFNWDELRRRLHSATSSLTLERSDADEAALLSERARILARAGDDAVPPGESLDIISFSISNEDYALEARLVHEVIRQPDITPVPNTPGFLLGIYNLRGEVLAVMDLRTVLNIPTERRVDEWLVVCGGERHEFGIVADAVSEVHELRLDTVLSPRMTTVAGGALIRGVTAAAVALLDGDALLQDQRLRVDVDGAASGPTT